VDVEGNIIWTRPRIFIAKTVGTQRFEFIMGILIMLNVVLIIWETDQSARCEDPLQYDTEADDEDCPYYGKNILWVRVTNLLLLGIYSAECAARLYVQRMIYFSNKWNKLDFFIVVSGIAGEFIGDIINLSLLKVFRLARLLRALRVLIAFRELYLMLHGFISAMRAILAGSALLLALLGVWAIVCVEYVHPINTRLWEGDAGERFIMHSVPRTFVTLFQQILCGDSWGATTIPVIEEMPGTAVIFVLCVISVDLGLSNLILAVIVECAQEARDSDKVNRVREKTMANKKQHQELMRMCERLDVDKSGSLDLEELMMGYDNSESFQALLRTMDVERDELKSVFKLLDEDGSGDVSYDEFCASLHKIRTRDPKTMVMFMRLSLQEMHRLLERDTMAASNKMNDISDSNSAGLVSIARKSGVAGALHHNAALPSNAPVAATTEGSSGWIGNEIELLRRRMLELASAKQAYARRCENNAATLMGQSEVLASVSAALPQVAQNHRGLSGEKALLERAGSSLGALRQSVDGELALLVLDSKCIVEDDGAALAESSVIHRSLGDLLHSKAPWNAPRGIYDG